MVDLKSPVLKSVPSPKHAGCVKGDFGTIVAPGIYELGFDYFETGILFGKAPKLIIWFKMFEFGKDFQKPLPRYYNVKKTKGRLGKYGYFEVGPRSDFIRDYGRLFGTPLNTKQIPMVQFESKIIKGRVKTVTKGRDGKLIPDGQLYSVVEELIEIKEI